MKRTICVLLTVLMALCLMTGCGGADESNLFQQLQNQDVGVSVKDNGNEGGFITDLFNGGNGNSNSGSSSAAVSSNGPEAVTRKFVQAVNDNDIEAYLECLPEETRQYVMDQLVNMGEDLDLKDLMSDGAEVTMTVHNVLMMGTGYAFVDNTISYADHEERTPVGCCCIDGRWYVDVNVDYTEYAEEGVTGTNSPEKTAQQYVDAVNNNDMQKLLDLVEPYERYDAAESFMEILMDETTLVEKFYGNADVRLKLTIEEVDADDEYGTVYCTISANGIEQSGEIDVVCEYGAWYIRDM